MDKNALAEQKFRPLKKQIQQTFRRIQQKVRAGAIPERRDVDEFVSQIAIMVSYPGFGDPGYPAIVAASRALAEGTTTNNLQGVREALDRILALQKRYHGGA